MSTDRRDLKSNGMQRKAGGPVAGGQANRLNNFVVCLPARMPSNSSFVFGSLYACGIGSEAGVDMDPSAVDLV